MSVKRGAEKRAAKLPVPQGPAANGFRYREQYGVVVICGGEAEQRRIYEGLRSLGLDCKVVNV